MATLASKRSMPLLLTLAVAIGVAVVTMVNGAFWLLGDVKFHVSSYLAIWGTDIVTVSAPFVLLALMRVSSKTPWMVGFVMTVMLWGYYLYDGLRGDTEGNVGANIGLGLIILVSPIVISLTCLMVAKLEDSSNRGNHNNS